MHNQDREVWIPVRGHEGLYEVSNLGRVRRDICAPHRSLGVPGRLLKPSSTAAGYLHVSLSNGGRVTTHRLHVIVMQSFCGPPPFEGAQICHNDGQKENCRLTNLRWDTAYGNQADVDRHGRRCRGIDVFGAVLDEHAVRNIRKRCADGEINRTIAEDYGVSVSTIHLIRHNKTWRHVK